MGTSKRHVMMEQLFDLEKTILQLKFRVGQLQKSLQQESTDRAIQKRFPLREWFGGRKAVVLSTAVIRENRRVERHGTSLF